MRFPDASWLRTWVRNSDLPPGFHFLTKPLDSAQFAHPTFFSSSSFEAFPGPEWFTDPTMA